MPRSNTVAGWKKFLPFLVICLCAIAVNANTLFNDFVFDDASQVVDNNWITSVKYLPDIFTHDATHAATLGSSNFYRPVMNVVYMANYYLFGGLRPWGFHLVNVLLHTAVALLVFLTARALLREGKTESQEPLLSAPLVAALVFALHPANSEVVAWVACVPELTFTLFCLTAFWFHRRSQRLFDRGHLLSLAAFTIAIFCKETAVTLVPILMLYDLVRRDSRPPLGSNLARYVLFALPIALYAGMRVHALGGMAPMIRHPELSSFEIVINAVPIFCQYLGKLLLPVNLTALYVLHPVHSLLDAKFLLAAACLLVFAAALVISFRKNRDAFLALSFVIVPLLPVLYIRALGNPFADRYLYFPSIGFALLAGMLFSYLRGKSSGAGKAAGAVLLAVLAIYATATVQRNEVWRDELTLWSDTVRKSPDSYMAHAELGRALNDMGDHDGALREYTASQRLCSERVALLKGIEGPGRDPERMAPLLKECYQSLALLHNGLGLAHFGKGEIASAVNEYRAALAMEDNYTSHVNLGNIFYANHNDEEALREYLAAIRLDNNSSEAHNNVGCIYLSHGQLDLAIKEFQQALALNPNLQDARENLQMAMAGKR